MASPPITVTVARGNSCTVEFAIRPSGACPAKDFFEGECEQIREGGKHKPESTARAKFTFLFQQMADCGNLSGKRFKPEMNGLSAFSHEVRNIQIRFPCFRDGGAWIVTHSFCKPGARKGLGDWPASQ